MCFCCVLLVGLAGLVDVVRRLAAQRLAPGPENTDIVRIDVGLAHVAGGAIGNEAGSDRREGKGGCRVRGEGCQSEQARASRDRPLGGQIVISSAADFVAGIACRHIEREMLTHGLLQFGLIDLFLGKICRKVIDVYGADIGWIDRIGKAVAIRAVDAAKTERCKRRRRGNAEEFARGQQGCQRRISVGCLVGKLVGQAPEHSGRIAMAKLLLDAAAAVALAEIIARNIDRRIGARLPAKRSAQRVHVAPVNPAVRSDVVGIAVAAVVHASQTDAERFAERDVQHALDADRVVLAVIGLTRRAESGKIGLGGDDIDHARGRISAKQGALWPAQHFDALEVEEFGFEQAALNHWHVVEMDACCGIARYPHAKVTDAANGETR